MVKEMEKVYIIIMMVIDMKEILKMVYLMENVFFIVITEINMKGN